jgi:secondary thiamine-phosphate synthase enzyme
MIMQVTFSLKPYSRGFHVVTQEILDQLGTLPETGLLHLFIQHTSAAIIINENADPDVCHDLELYFNALAPERFKGMRHTLEGPDDMPAHVKAAMTGSSVTIPISQHRISLGTWQGIYLCEFRTHSRQRNIVATVYS